MPFFNLGTPRDMLEKARREYRKLEENFDIDSVFNFFVTAYHVQDYIEENRTISRAVKKAKNRLIMSPDMDACRLMCNKGKHLVLRKGDPATHVWSGCFNGAPIGVMPINGGDKWVLVTSIGQFDVKWLAKRVLEKWEKFFEDNKL